MRLGNAVSIKNRLKVVQKEGLARIGSHFFPVYLVNEYPKSGGTWVKMMLSDALELPAWTKSTLPWGSCVMQAHWMQARGNCKTVALLRDGRDVMVSYYFHSFFQNEHDNGKYVAEMRTRFAFDDFEDVKSNLLPFMKLVLDNPVSPGFSWVDFMGAWSNRPGVINCKYEDLRQDTPKALQNLVQELTGRNIGHQRASEIADYYSIDNMRARQQKERQDAGTPPRTTQTQFIRKGAVRGWPEFFSDESHEWFLNRAGEQLSLAGYS